MLTLTAFAVLGFTIPDPAVPCTAKRPPDDDDFEEVTVYKGFRRAKKISPSEFNFEGDGLSTYEVIFPGRYELLVPFTVRYKGKKVPGVTGQVIGPPIPGLTATYTPQFGDPTIGVDHWSFNVSGSESLASVKQTLSQYAKDYRNKQ